MSKCLLGDIAESQTGPFGSQLHESDYVEQGTPIVTVEHLGDTGFTKQNLPLISEKDTERLSKFLLKEGDIVFSRVGSIDKSVYVKKEQEGWLFSGRCLRVRCDKTKINPRYLSFYFKLEDFKKIVLNISVGVTMPSLNTKLMNNILLDIPKREIQDKIASLLDAIDSKIENNNKINAELELAAKTIYDYWFLQFEFSDEDGKPYKSSGGKMVWNEELKRKIPEKWQVGKLNDFIMQDKGGDWGKETKGDKYTKKVTCLRGADFPSICGMAKLEAPERFINERNIHKILTDGDLVIEISGGSPTQSTGRICYINDITLTRFKNELITSNFCKAISLIDTKFMYWFYILWCKLYDNGIFFKYEGKTTGIKNLLFDMLCKDYPIIIPNFNTIKRYNDKVRKFFDAIQENRLENEELASLRDFLLPLLMNGQVGFKN